MINNALTQAQDLKASTSRYVKLEDGKPVTLRLFDIITGFEIWNEEDGKRTPNRCKPGADNKHQFSEAVLTKAGFNDWGKPVMPQVFVAFSAYDYEDRVMKIFQVNKVGGKAKILNDLAMMQSNPKWGDLSKYDVTILASKGKEDGRWTGSAQPEPADPKDKSAVEAYKKEPVNLEALYYGLDPFDKDVADKIKDAQESEAQVKAVEENVIAENDGDDVPF